MIIAAQAYDTYDAIKRFAKNPDLKNNLALGFLLDRVQLLFMLKAINLKPLPLDHVDIASKKVELLLGCTTNETQTQSHMDAKTYYELLLGAVNKTLSPDGLIIDKKDNK